MGFPYRLFACLRGRALAARRRFRTWPAKTVVPAPVRIALPVSGSDPARSRPGDDIVWTAFLTLLKRLLPDERAAFLLYEVYGGDYDQVARALGKNKNACRLLVQRAKTRFHIDRPR